MRETIIKLPEEYENPAKFLKLIKEKPEDHWIERGEKMALKLFHMMAKRVPAYKDWLKKQGINPEKIKTIVDFKKVPTIDKDNYLRKYDLKDLCWDGILDHGWHVYSATSGSTGEPFYFPRTEIQDKQYSVTAEMYLLNNFEINKKTTLYIDSFAMGAWIGGLFTYQAVKNVAQRGKYNISIITPGVNKNEIINAIKKLGHDYDQIILGGYPPFVKDTIDEGINQGLNWKDYQVKFIFSAEAFSEEFRDYIANKTGIKDVCLLTLNHYGTVDQGTIAHETPLSILLRRIALKDERIYRALFDDANKLPTLAQYLPEMFYFEIVNDKDIICSAQSGIPLVRYDLKDNGGAFTLKSIKDKLIDLGVDLNKEIKNAGIEKALMNLPFVYVYERKDLSVVLSGANIYPEPIKKILYTKDYQKFFTGKFTMLTPRDKNQDPYLEINVELRKGVDQPNEKLKKELVKDIEEKLLKENSEYEVIHGVMKERATPHIIFWQCNHEKYFCLGGKQKWVVK